MDGKILAGRYRCLRKLGRGGMADVFEAIDERSGQRLALKALRFDREDSAVRALRRSLFEREFYVLAQLAHPRIVSVFDYGLTEDGPFYTMELLEGCDLLDAAPLPWQGACAVLRDVCSALSLLHSRRLLYRDVSPRNVFHCRTGVGKLLDFGALLPLGNSDKILGTAPFLSPEAFHRDLLDGRSDLFGVGATLHFALTGQLLFPANGFEELPLVWQLPIRPPSELTDGIPRELDALVLDLVQLDPSLRPGSAGEVIDRLEAIANLPPGDHLVVARAYLSTPELVERDAPLEEARQCLQQACRGRGAALLVTGAPGTGRTRFLDACLLHGKLQGMTTLVVRAGDGPCEAYAAARTLAAQLLEMAPERARRAAAPLLAILGHVVPTLLEGTPIDLVHFEDPRALRPALQVALRAWLEASSENHPLLIAIDDFEQLDEPSAALMALLATDARKHSLTILASVESESAAHAMSFAVLRRAASPLALGKLSQAGTWRLLASLFGDTARLALVAARVHAVADGNPRDVMQLTQDLVDRTLIRTEAGIWAMPSTLHVDALPGSATEAMRKRARALGERARELAQLLALSRLPSLGLDDFLALSGAALGEILDGLGELVTAALLRVDANAHRFAHHAWRGVLTEGLAPELRRDLHARLARWVVLTRREPLREIQHLRGAERGTEALDRLVAFCAASQEETRANPALLPAFVAQLPSDWYELFEWGIQASLASGRPASDLCALRGRMAGILPTAAPHLGAQHVTDLIARLRLDSGLDLYQTTDPSLEPAARLRMALAGAQRRFETTAERERGFSPPRAVRVLGEMMIPAAALAATNYDYPLLRSVPRLDALHALSPALRVVSLVWRGLEERMAGRLEAALTHYRQAAALLGEPDRGGLAPSHAKYTRLGVIWGMGFIEAMLGRPECLVHAELLKEEPWYRGSGILIAMLHAYWQGEPERGDAEKGQWVLCLIESNSGSWFEGGHLVAELTAHALAGDLDRLKSLLPDVARLADVAPGWGPVLAYARGEYHRLRGDLTRALVDLEQARTAQPACKHQIWAHAASAELQVLLALERYDSAVELGERHLDEAVRARLEHGAEHIRIPLSRAYAARGQPARGLEMIERVRRSLEEGGTTGLLLGWVHETLVQIALLAGDDALAQRAFTASLEQFHPDSSPLSRRRCERLEAAIEAHTASLARQQVDARLALLASRVGTMLGEKHTAKDRAGALLQLLLDETGASGGLLHIAGSPSHDAATAGMEPDLLEMEELLAQTLRHWLGDSASEPALSTITALGSSSSPLAQRVRPLILEHSTNEKRVITGTALMVVEPDAQFVEPVSLLQVMSEALSHS